MAKAKRSQQEIVAAGLRRRLEEFQYKNWRYREDFGEIWPGTFDGPLVTPYPHLLETCRVLPHRFEIIRALPQGGVFAEVGTLHGDFIVECIKINKPAEVHIFDIDFSNFRPENRKIINEHGKVVLHDGDSSTNLTKLASSDIRFDIIYIDGDHTYDGAWKDLSASLPLLKPDGFIVCNDYTTWDPISAMPYGVFSAVNRFANENDFALEYFALEPCGFHDVALRRLTR